MLTANPSPKVPTTILFSGSLSALGRKWYEKIADTRDSLAISQLFNLSPFVGKLLATRGLTPETVADYLNPTLKQLMPDPSHLKDMDKGVSRVGRAIRTQEKIAVFGDYDVDGATASSLLKRYFEDIGVDITVYIPQRIEEGYGPNLPALTHLKQQGHGVVIMVDCGTTAFEALAHAKTIGLDVIIIDHHMSAPLLPDVTALINPNRIDETSPLGTLCAAALSFVFLVALHRALRNEGWFREGKKEPDLRSYLDLVALGTVCDVMPLTGLNRAFVTQGLKILHHRANLGLKALADIAGIDESPSAYHLGFMLGPRINAGGRVGKANFGTRLLSSRDTIETQHLARELDLLNKERQAIEIIVLEQATKQILQQRLHENPLIMVGDEGWHIGVIGIVAGRLKERFQKPVCVVGFDAEVGKGSGRSITGVNLGAAMHAACQKGLLVHGGGHAMAAGFTVMRDQFAGFQDFLCHHLATAVAGIEPRLDLDAVLSPAAATVEFLTELSLLEPYGNGNPTPKFCLHKVRLTGVERVGVNHLRAFAYGEDGTRVKIMAFRALDTELGEKMHQLQGGRMIALAGTLKLDKWNGREEVTIILDDLMDLE
ncbi:single-stranded-DNA-specific exonuclease RecJ [Candidatus Paracaedibacter symbiosus]|uniref:single-stranded-DNA-specific exonuclease RecJ n=1 Tax=Candidatus Paracaedibacter symbiosus TaxID=244582 RepID=UPI00094F1B8A|nr:single-stranded-DNA-specific exonuclease RecJ [Candidatus Paracaedibacter symbiosus]